MKLDEIRLVRSGYRNKRYKLTDFNIENGIVFGYSEGDTVIIKTPSPKDSRVILFALCNSQQAFLSGVVGYFCDWQGTEYFIVLDAFTPEPLRHKGYATALYTSLVKKYNIKLMSDKEQTDDGKRLWTGISKILNVQVLDATNNTLLPRNQVSDDAIYINEPDRYLLIAEHVLSGIDLIGIPNVGSGILEGRQIYTHPDNIGLYE